jgi:outer membrane protein
MKATRLIFALVAFSVFLNGTSLAQQKIGYINSEAIMKQLPEAGDAQKQIDALISDWQAELAKLQSEYKTAQEDFEKKKLVMTEQKRTDAEKELKDREQKIATFRTQKFGPNGELFVKQNELMKPVQDRIFKGIKEVALEDGYDYIFDKSGQILLMYTNEKYDLTAKVLEKIKMVVRTQPGK